MILRHLKNARDDELRGLRGVVVSLTDHDPLGLRYSPMSREAELTSPSPPPLLSHTQHPPLRLHGGRIHSTHFTS